MRRVSLGTAPSPSPGSTGGNSPRWAVSGWAAQGNSDGGYCPDCHELLSWPGKVNADDLQSWIQLLLGPKHSASENCCPVSPDGFRH